MWGVYAGSCVTGALRVGLTGTPGTGKTTVAKAISDLAVTLNVSDLAEEKGFLGSFEPDEEVILDDIIPKNIAIQIHSALLENLASEQGSRMTAMDNATRNANDMIDKLTLFYNRSRQALITKELIEIISGAEAV